MQKLIATIPKNSNEELRITLDKYKGYRLLSLCVWIKPQENKLKDIVSKFVPKSKAFSIQLMYVEPLLEAIEKALKTIKSEHLIEAEQVELLDVR